VPRILVTGGAGFIGSAFVRHLLDTDDDQVVVLDALTYAGGRDNLTDVLGPRCELLVGDVRDRAAVRRALEGCGQVVHLAAESHVDRSIVDPDAFVSTNCGGTNVVLDEARRAGVERVLHVSTDEVYGSIAEGRVDEDAPLRPSSPYSASKAASDLIALSYHRTFGLDVVVTRGANTYGPRQFPEKIIPLFVTRLFRGERVPLYGDGTNVREWLHVDDHAAGIAAVLRRGTAGGVYNMGGGTPLANRALAERLLALCGADSSWIEWVPDRPGHDQRYAVDSGRLERLGWAPAVSFDEGLAATVDWYRTNVDWWARRRTAPDGR
jgi:dTDP-glucose 4,6-dehydratase